MNFLKRAALAAAIAWLSIVPPLPAFAGDGACDPAHQVSEAREVAKTALAAGRFTAVVDLTGADLLAFIRAANLQFKTNIPADGQVDEGLVVVVDGRTVFFGFTKGCQVGAVVLPAMPKQVSAPALLPNGQRVI